MSWDDDTKVYRHESYGTVQVSRRTGGHKVLFQSALKHNHTIALSIRPAEVQRNLNNDWVFSQEPGYIEVEMSEAQWASFVSSIGMGSGVPCTVNYAMTEGFKRMENPPEEGGRGGTREEFTKEFEQTVRERVENVKEAEQMVAGLLDKKGNPTKADLRRLKTLLGSASSGLANTASFILNQFEEQTEKNVEAAKSEFQAHAHQVVRTAGLEALGKDAEDRAKELENRLGNKKDDNE